ncbi:MAG TPA: hypothetical protein VFE13_18400 [Caulobacteraceae bacterium]|jgi:hypothetical protein|nr:hypothetical protein [Caulobacteraceae bacterium]
MPARRHIRLIGALAGGAVAATPLAAGAQTILFAPETLHAVVDLRVAAADGEPSFTQGGFGKAVYGGDGSSALKGHVDVALAAVEWTPRLNWDWSAVIDVAHQPGQEHAVDLLQAYALYKPTPSSATRFQARFGYFYPPISLEHDHKVWGLANEITPSAINSWVGEEVKVVGAEATVSQDTGLGRFAATAALFGYDDTAGTLLSFRGWALDDRQGQLRGVFPLPPRSPFFDAAQDDETYTTLEIDRRIGEYGKLAWDLADWPVTLEALHYNNAGDRVSVVEPVQWAWATNFTNLGATAKLGDHTRLKAQALWGRTQFGFPTPQGIWVDVIFRSAYLLASQEVGDDTFTLRGDLFDAKDKTEAFGDDKNERGWAITAAWRRPLSRHIDLRVEALHVDSNRPARSLAGEPPGQAQTVLQSSLRFTM